MRQKTLNTRQLLHGVSRSFGLSIRLLPQALREPVGLAYLLARATDTVADTAHVAREERHRLLDRPPEGIGIGAGQVGGIAARREGGDGHLDLVLADRKSVV